MANRFAGIVSRNKQKPPKMAARPGPIGKSRDPNFSMLTAYVTKDFHRRFKAEAAMAGMEISQMIEAIGNFWLNGTAPPSGPWEKTIRVIPLEIARVPPQKEDGVPIPKKKS
jgi:hypothetical protein